MEFSGDFGQSLAAVMQLNDVLANRKRVRAGHNRPP
jgi:hypothetical protein